VVVAVCPSPKFHSYSAIAPTGLVEAEASKLVAWPGGEFGWEREGEVAEQFDVLVLER
jgi:hypothetical protein